MELARIVDEADEIVVGKLLARKDLPRSLAPLN